MNRATYYSPQAGRLIDAPRQTRARFAIGDVVKHRHYDFRGVVFDIDPVFANSEEWYQSIPADVRPTREQPFYHLLAENEDAVREHAARGQDAVAAHDHGAVVQ